MASSNNVEVPKNSYIIRDEVILLTAQQEIGKEAFLRRIEIWVEEKNETIGQLALTFGR